MSDDTKEERMISIDDFTQVIGRAAALQAIDASRRNDALMPLVAGDDSGRRSVPVSQLYDSASGVGITREYVDRALAAGSISLEEKMNDVREFSAEPSTEVVVMAYVRELMSTIRAAFPDRTFKINSFGDYYEGYDKNLVGGFAIVEATTSKKKERAFPWFRKKEVAVTEMKTLATINMYHRSVMVYDPLFLNTCGDTLKKLGAEFGRFKFTHNYELR